MANPKKTSTTLRSRTWRIVLLTILIIAVLVVFWAYRGQPGGNARLIRAVCRDGTEVLAAMLIFQLSVGRAAKNILKQQKQVYGDLHEYALTSLDDFPQLDHAFYERATQWCTSNGFRYLGNRENLTLSKIFPDMRTVLRTFLSEDGTIVGVAYHVRIRRASAWKDVRTTEFESELDDGSFITTSNAKGSARTPPYPRIDSRKFDAGTPLGELIAAHEAALNEVTAARADAGFVQMATMDDVIHFQHRMHAQKVAYKTARGFVGKEDLEAVRQRKLNRRELAVAEELERLKQLEGLGE